MPPISLFEKLTLVLRGLGIIPHMLYAAIHTRSPRKIRIAVNRYITGALSISQIQYVMSPTLSTYRAFTSSPLSSSSSSANITEIPGDAPCRLLWLGQYQPGKKVLLYFHGGGYVMPITKEHLMYCEYVRSTVGPEDLAVAVLEYTNTPGRRYPYQLAQASAALSHLLASGVAPADLVLGGDSAGGHLVLSVISHVLHTHPSVRAVSPALAAPLAGICLLSPATTFRVTADSFRRNDGRDIIKQSTCEYWSAQLTGGDSGYWDEAEGGGWWGEVVSAPEDWWRGVAGVVKRCLVTAGEREVILDDILRLGETFEKLGEDWTVERVLGKGEIHDSALMDYILEKKACGETTIRSAKWVGEALGIAARV